MSAWSCPKTTSRESEETSFPYLRTHSEIPQSWLSSQSLLAIPHAGPKFYQGFVYRVYADQPYARIIQIQDNVDRK